MELAFERKRNVPSSIEPFREALVAFTKFDQLGPTIVGQLGALVLCERAVDGLVATTDERLAHGRDDVVPARDRQALLVAAGLSRFDQECRLEMAGFQDRQ